MTPETAPLFVVGTGRSGTTLLRNMLCAHPRIYIAFETMYYVYEAMYRRKASRREFLDYYFHTSHFRWMKLDAGAILAELDEDEASPRYAGAAFAAILRAKARQHGRVRFGDKTPLHSSRLDRIFADFPDARVVHIVRDPRGAACSLGRMPWASASTMVNAYYLRNERREVLRWGDRVLKIRLEDLLAEPRAVMERVLEHVGEPWDDAVLDHVHRNPAAGDVPPYPWLASAATERVSSGKPWAKMSPVDIRLVELITREVMDACGYETAPLEHEPSRLRVRWEGLRQIPQYLRYLWLWGTTLRRARRVENIDECQQSLLRRMNPGAWAQYPGFVLPSIPPLVMRSLPEPDTRTARPAS